MRKYLIFSLILLFSNVKAQNWNLIWSDEFDSDQVDPNKWDFQNGTGSEFGLWGWGNGESQYYQEENASVNNGILTIEAKEEPQGIIDSWNNTKYFSSSKLVTKGKFEFRYGKVEARIKTIDGQGFWQVVEFYPFLCTV